MPSVTWPANSYRDYVLATIQVTSQTSLSPREWCERIASIAEMLYLNELAFHARREAEKEFSARKAQEERDAEELRRDGPTAMSILYSGDWESLRQTLSFTVGSATRVREILEKLDTYLALHEGPVKEETRQLFGRVINTIRNLAAESYTAWSGQNSQVLENLRREKSYHEPLAISLLNRPTWTKLQGILAGALTEHTTGQELLEKMQSYKGPEGKKRFLGQIAEGIKERMPEVYRRWETANKAAGKT